MNISRCHRVPHVIRETVNTLSKITVLLQRIFDDLLYKLRVWLKFGITDVITDVNIETTTLCNRRCWHCPNSIFDRSLKKNEKIMPESLFKKIIDELAELNYQGRVSPHLYGEPLLDTRLVRLMEYAHTKIPKANLLIYTNGDFLDREVIDKLYEAGVNSFFVSLHSGTRKDEERIKKLKEYVERTNKKICIDYQIFDNTVPLATRIGLVHVDKVMDFPPCLADDNPATINYQGDFQLCCNDYLGEIAFGNVANERLMDIWTKKSFQNVRKQLKRRVYVLDICKRCVNS